MKPADADASWVSPPDPKAPSLRLHLKMGPLGGTLFVILFVWQILRSLPALLTTALWYRQRRRQAQAQALTVGAEPHAQAMHVAWVGGNLDEVNGIALSSRKLLQAIRAQGHALWMYGVAFHTKPPRSEGPEGSVIMAPGPYSIDQAGYASSELALVDLVHFCSFLREKAIDLVEFETPGPIEMLCLLACRIAGVRTCSHYRTDIFTYSEMLVDNAVGVFCIQTWTRLFTALSGPVIVPSEAYRAKVAAMGIAPKRITKLSRGVDTRAFHPELRADDLWTRLKLPRTEARLLYVGRISKEKNLEALVEALVILSQRRQDFHLAVVGDGPYRDEMEARLKPTGCASFTGVLTGDRLHGIYAAGDLFVFPSTTDTFGNSVVEALASGLPCLVSDEGGPCEIVREGDCGFVFTARQATSLAQTLEHALEHKDTWEGLRVKARARAENFTFEHSAQEFWAFYLKQLANPKE